LDTLDSFVEAMPRVEFSVDLDVDGSCEVLTDDVVTLKIKLHRHFGDEGPFLFQCHLLFGLVLRDVAALSETADEPVGSDEKNVESESANDPPSPMSKVRCGIAFSHHCFLTRCRGAVARTSMTSI
jgi:hypothetical protein